MSVRPPAVVDARKLHFLVILVVRVDAPHVVMRAEQSAITVARQINTAEAQQSSTKRYVPLLDLADVTVPEGFEAQVSTGTTTYTFSVKDRPRCSRASVSSDLRR